MSHIAWFSIESNNKKNIQQKYTTNIQKIYNREKIQKKNTVLKYR